ncbi:uncharacterized protein LOC118487514 [Helianthus annuus]|uniref:uncharacterized protein LOC118487514 n=1 Tax=Helianthus annuus TaxID=4232 RepID=UPI001652F007|nr:uncharacterized protein LOC118487514 [Helianthus annuus]
MASVLHYKVGRIPVIHLGLKVGANMSLINNWQPVLYIADARLAGWKANSLSMGGTFKMDDIFTNPFSDMYGFTVSSGGSGNPENDDSTSNNTNTNQIKEKRKEAWESESAFGTFNRPPKLMAIEDYTRWAIKFEEWLMAFAFPSWKSMKSGYAAGKNNGEVLRSNEEIDLFVAEQKCVALLFQSVREDIISLISYTNAKDLWDKLGKKCLGSKEILKNKTKLLKKEFDMFSCFKNESVCKMIERFGHLKLELARHDIKYPDEEIVDKLFDSLPDEMDWRYYALMLKNTIPPEELKPDVVIERLESHELELKKTYKVNHSYQQNPELYYPKSLMPKASSPKTAFSAENISPAPKENQSNSNKESHSGYHSGSTSISTASTNRSDSKFSCNIAVDLKNAQNFDEESVKQQMVFLASVLESYEGLIAGKIGNTNLTKEDYDQIDPEEMELIDIQWAMASAKGHFKRECRNAYVEESENPFKDDYYKKAIYHQNKSEPPRIKQSEDNKGKSRALAVIYDDEGYDWSKEVLPEDDAIGYAFMASHNEPIQWKDNRTEQQKYEYRKMVAEAKIIRLSGVYEEATRANRWDPDRECYLDEYGNIAVDYKKIDIEAIIQEYKEEDEYWQHKWWGTPTSKMIEEEREKERREKEKIEEPVKIDTGLINTAQEMTAENLREMADKVLAVKALEVDSTPNSESKKQVSQTKSSTVSVVDGIVSVDAETTVDDDDKQSAMGRGKDTHKGHNVPSAIDEGSTKGTEAEKMAECLRKSRIAKALSDTTIVYESHVRRFWDTARFEEKDNKIHAVVKKKDENNKDIDVEVVFGVEDIRRVLDLQDSDNDPTIMSERLAKGLWCRLGFSSHINGKMFKRSFSSQYRYLMHCLVHSLSHRKGAYDEVSDYIMNIVVKNCLAGRDKYIMYPRFIMMILNDKVKDLPKNNDDIMTMAEVNKTAIQRITKEKDAKTKELICALKDEAYVAPENDKWRHDNSDSDNEDNKMSEMIEKKTRWWCIKDGKRKRTPKSTPVVVIKETAKGSSEEPQRKLIDEPVIEPREVVDKGVGLKETLESYFKKHEEAEQAQAQKNSSNEDSEETLSESELVEETMGKGKVQLKKRPLKKRKNYEDEDSPYNPEDSQKNRKKRKATRSGDIPRVVRAKKQNAKSQKEKEGKKKQDTAETSPVVEIPKEVPLTEIPIETQTSYDDYVEITGVKSAKQTSDRHDIPESSQRKTDYFNLDFDSLGGATGDFFKDMPESEGDLFHDKKMKELEEKVKALEKEKEENEAVQIKLKEMIDELEKRHEDVMDAVLTKDEKLNEMKEDIKDNAEVISALTDEIAALNAKVKDLQNINQTLNQLLNEMNEASTNEMKAMKLEMEAMRADKVMKDKQLEMLTAVIEAHLKVNIHEAFDQVDIIKANERRKERERQLAEEANLKNKGIAEEVEVVGSSQNQLEVGGSSSQPEIEMVDAQDVTVNDEEMVEAEIEVVHEPEFIMVGESVEPIIPENVLRDVQIIQRKKKAKEVLLLEYSTDKFVLVGNAYRVPYSEEESAKLLRFFELKDQWKIARGEVEEESDSDFWEEEDEDDDKDDKADDKSDNDDKPDDDDDDQGTSGLLINDPSVQDKVNELMNDEVNEQNDDAECEGSSSGNQSGDQVHQLTSTFISLSEYHQGEVDIIRTRAEMLEELGLEDGKFKFDIEDEIPESPIKNFEPQFPLEAEFYDNVTVETDSDSEEDRIDFHYEGEDMAFPTFTELFEDMNAELLKRKIEERVASADMPEPVPREISVEERKKWFRSMPKERKPLRALQYFTHDKDLSWGDILSWGYLEDLNVYAIRREQGVQYFRCISDLATLPWWDVDELVVTKNIKQLYYGPEVKQRDQKLWNYIKYQATINYPDWKPQFPKRIVKYTAKGEKDVTLDVKPPKCLKSMPLRAIEQDFYDLFQAWLYNPSTAEAVISLYDKDTGEARKICILDPMWLVNCSKKDIDCLFVNKIIYDKKDKAIAQQYQSVVDVCFAKEINSGKNWKTSWRELEVDEFLKVYKRSLRSKEIQRKAVERGRRNLGFVPPTDQTPIESEENKIPKWDRKRDGDPVYRNWWITEGRHKRRQMLAEREEKRKQKARDRRRNRK